MCFRICQCFCAGIGSAEDMTPTLAKSEKILCILFLLSLVFVTPSVRGDGIGYYALARALVIQHDLHFEKDWRVGYPNLNWGNPDGKGNVNPLQYTTTGHLDNYFSVGPALLWAPFLVIAHLAVLAANALGAHSVADGFSRPYLFAMSIGTAFYGFLALLISFRFARSYFEERWALLSTLGIWLGSSLPAYIYAEPSWSHAHSAFAIALFLFYWDRTRPGRTYAQWSVLALCAGIMINVYYVNAVFLLVPGLESLSRLRQERRAVRPLFASNVLFAAVVLLALLPTFVTKSIIYGVVFHSGYMPLAKWNWTSPHLLGVLFSSTHGLLSWTPVLIPALLGLLQLPKRVHDLGRSFLIACLVFYYIIASYPFWHAVTSFGNRFFISLTPIFVLGLACALESCARLWRDQRAAFLRASVVVALLILWNVGFMFQFATHMIPERGPAPWREMIYNQFRIVPHDLPLAAWHRLTGR
jgi:hypothetical protein